MNEIQVMSKKIIEWSVFFTAGVSILAGFFFQDIKVVLGIILGQVIALVGYLIIVRMALSLGTDEKAGKSQGMTGYLVRYLLYACFFGFGAYTGLSVIALLIGFLCHKAAILLYAYQQRKD